MTVCQCYSSRIGLGDVPLKVASLSKVFPHPGEGQVKLLSDLLRLSLLFPVVSGLPIDMEVGLPRPVAEETEKSCRLGMNGRG